MVSRLVSILQFNKNMDTLIFSLVPLITPVIVEMIKKLFEKYGSQIQLKDKMKPWLPVIAAGLGFAQVILAQMATGASIQPIAAALAGLGAIGVREVVHNLRKQGVLPEPQQDPPPTTP